jgi:hypothetical protein
MLASTGQTFYMMLAEADGDTTYTGNGVDGIDVYMPQLNEGGIKPSVGTYNYFLDDGTNDKGLNDFTDGGTIAITLGTNDVDGPDGLQIAASMSTSVSAAGTLNAQAAFTVPAEGYYWFSAWFKKNTAVDWVRYEVKDAPGHTGTKKVDFDLRDGTIGTILTTTTDHGHQVDWYGGYCRVATKIWLDATDLTGNIQYHLLEGDGDPSWAGTGGTEKVDTWGHCIQATTLEGALPPYPGTPALSRLGSHTDTVQADGVSAGRCGDEPCHRV